MSSQSSTPKKPKGEIIVGEEHVRSIAEASPDIIVITRLSDGFIVYANPATHFVSGYSPNEIIGRVAPDFYANPADRDKYVKLLRETGKARNHKVLLKNKDGTEFWVRANSRVVTISDEPHIIGELEDITTQKQAEDELARVNRILQAHLACNEAILNATDEDELTAAVCKALVGTVDYRLVWIGYAKDDPEKSVQPVASYGNDDGYVSSANVTYADTERGQGPVGSSIRTGKPVAIQNYLENPKFAPWKDAAIERGIAAGIGVPLLNGGKAFGSVNLYAPEPNAFDPAEVELLVRLANIISHGIVSLREASKKREAEDMLHKLSTALEQSPNMVFITNTEGSIEYINTSFTKMSGYTSEDVYGKNPRILKSGNTPVEVYQELWKTILSGKDWRGILCDKRKDGAEFWARASISPIRNRAGEITHFVALHEDITEEQTREVRLLEAKRQAEVANRAKSELMANMSHELRTPLNAIIGFSCTMKEEVLGPIDNDKYLEYLSDIHHSGQHLLELINDILDTSTIEAGALKLHEENISIRNITDTTIRLIQPRATKGNVTVVSNIDPELPQLFADERRMKQVLLNLLSNAVKFTLEGGEVSVSARLNDDGSFSIVVADTGVGMDTDELGKALSKFGQVDSGLDRKHEGTGLGLPLTIGLIEVHGGTLKLKSKKGHGTQITATLPKERVVRNVRFGSEADVTTSPQ